MTQGRCKACNNYFLFVRRDLLGCGEHKKVDIHRVKAKCPLCGEQLSSTTHQVKNVNSKYKWDVDTWKAVDVRYKGVHY